MQKPLDVYIVFQDFKAYYSTCFHILLLYNFGLCVCVTTKSIRIRRYFNDHENTLCCQQISGNMAWLSSPAVRNRGRPSISQYVYWATMNMTIFDIRSHIHGMKYEHAWLSLSCCQERRGRYCNMYIERLCIWIWLFSIFIVMFRVWSLNTQLHAVIMTSWHLSRTNTVWFCPL